MNRQQKEKVVQNLREQFTSNPASFVVEYKGLSVGQLQTLRRQLREKGGTLKVAKARLIKRAVDGIEGVQDISPYLQQQIAVVFAMEEVPAIAKVLKDFSKNNEALGMVVGCLESELLSAESVVRIASLPPREVLLGQVCGALNAPVAGLANVLHILVVRLLWVLKQIEQQK